MTAGINTAGVITGFSYDNFGQHGFLRAPDGTFTAFDPPPGSPAFSYTDTFPSAINPAGTITGMYFANNQYHGFVWKKPPTGQFISFDPPGSTTYPPSTNTTTPTAINPQGEITGYYIGPYPNGVNYGFLLTP